MRHLTEWLLTWLMVVALLALVVSRYGATVAGWVGR